IEARTVRGQILAGEPRIDGRDTRTVRPIEARLSRPDASSPAPNWTVLEKLSTTRN
ncbi:MAG: hypothetical protein EAZ40_14345, partial [Rhodobacterales bacterium]